MGKGETLFMAEVKTMRLSKVLREFNISLDRAVEFLSSKGYEVDARPTTKISGEEYQVLFEEFQTDKSKKVASKEVGEEKRKEKEELRLAREKEQEEKDKAEASKVIKAEAKLDGPKQVGKIDLGGDKKQEEPKAKEEAPKAEEKVEAKKEEKAPEKKKEEAPKAKKKAVKPKKEASESKPAETKKEEVK